MNECVHIWTGTPSHWSRGKQGVNFTTDLSTAVNTNMHKTICAVICTVVCYYKNNIILNIATQIQLWFHEPWCKSSCYVFHSHLYQCSNSFTIFNKKDQGLYRLQSVPAMQIHAKLFQLIYRISIRMFTENTAVVTDNIPSPFAPSFMSSFPE